MRVDTLQTPLSEILLRNGEGATEQTLGSKEGTVILKMGNTARLHIVVCI